jgi:hypothetical protein
MSKKIQYDREIMNFYLKKTYIRDGSYDKLSNHKEKRKREGYIESLQDVGAKFLYFI